MNADQAQRAAKLEDTYHVDGAGWWIDDSGTWLGGIADGEHWEIIIADEEGAPKWEVNGWPPARAVVVATLAKLGLPNTWSPNEMGWLNVDKILAYDAEREDDKFDAPVESDIAYCLRSIADKPHRAPLYLRDLVKQIFRAAAGVD